MHLYSALVQFASESVSLKEEHFYLIYTYMLNIWQFMLPHTFLTTVSKSAKTIFVTWGRRVIYHKLSAHQYDCSATVIRRHHVCFPVTFVRKLLVHS